MLVLGVHDYMGCAVVERLDHLALVKWHPVSRLVAIAIAADGPSALVFLKFSRVRNRLESLVMWNMVEYFTGHVLSVLPG